jgi:hypothetical protein
MRLSAFLIGSITVLVGTLAAEVTSAKSTTEKLSKTCGAIVATIACDPRSKDCTQTTLDLRAKNGKSTILPKPKGLERYTAVGLACVAARDQSKYISVQYGSIPEGCQFCEWVALYSTKGELLTNNDPPVLIDEAMPDGRQQYPNNQEYSDMSKRLGLSKPKFEFFP